MPPHAVQYGQRLDFSIIIQLFVQHYGIVPIQRHFLNQVDVPSIRACDIVNTLPVGQLHASPIANQVIHFFLIRVLPCQFPANRIEFLRCFNVNRA